MSPPYKCSVRLAGLGHQIFILKTTGSNPVPSTTSIINAFGEGSSPSWPVIPASPWILDKIISRNGSVAKW